MTYNMKLLIVFVFCMTIIFVGKCSAVEVESRVSDSDRNVRIVAWYSTIQDCWAGQQLALAVMKQSDFYDRWSITCTPTEELSGTTITLDQGE